MKIQHVTVEWVPQVWPSVSGFLEQALEFAKGDYTLAHAQALLATGRWLLLVAVDDDGKIHGAAAVEMYNRPAQRVAFIIAIGGHLISSPETFQQLKTLLASFGATHIEGAAREAIARLWQRYGFEAKYQVVGVKI